MVSKRERALPAELRVSVQEVEQGWRRTGKVLLNLTSEEQQLLEETAEEKGMPPAVLARLIVVYALRKGKEEAQAGEKGSMSLSPYASDEGP